MARCKGIVKYESVLKCDFGASPHRSSTRQPAGRAADAQFRVTGRIGYTPTTIGLIGSIESS
jgi:hypothetical protein